MNHWLKIVSIVELDPQAKLTIRLPILSKNIIHYDVRCASRPVGLLHYHVFFAVRKSESPVKKVRKFAFITFSIRFQELLQAAFTLAIFCSAVRR